MTNVAGIALTVALAVVMRNAWALVIGLLLTAALGTVLSYVFHCYRPRFAFEKRALRRVLSAGKVTGPGNIRELQNVVERALILSPGPILAFEPDLISVSPSKTLLDTTREVFEATQPTGPSSWFKTLDEVERAHISSAVLQQTHGVVEGVTGAAKTFRMHPNTLRHRMEKLGIKRSAPPHIVARLPKTNLFNY